MHREKGHIRKSYLLIALLFCFLITSPAFSEEVANKSVSLDANDISFYKCSDTTDVYPLIEGSKVKNVIFCIGDGMGISQVALARITALGNDGKLYMERMPISAIVRTHSLSSIVTDSAASGTALATGFKTNNGMIGMLSDGKKCVTIAEAAKDKGMATGLVATSTITHATPASFGAHVVSRGMEAKIAEGLLANKINVLLGGGSKFFLPKSAKESKRGDERNLISEAKEAGYKYIDSKEALSSVEGPYVLGLFQSGPMTTLANEPSIAEMTEKAIEILDKNEKGFFLMVEGSQIDWACHKNDEARAIKQTLLFDEAVKAAIDFALKDKQTLVVVTADHETGGLIVGKGKLPKEKMSLYWASKTHSATPVPLYAFGPGASDFAGVYDNTDIPKKFAKLLGIESFPQAIE